MTIEFDDKGKFFTDIIPKTPIPVMIQTGTHRIQGNIHVCQDQRLKDELDLPEKFIAITEVAGMEGDVVVLSDIFKFNQTGVDAEGKILGQVKPTSIRPLFSPRFEAAGFKLGAEMFSATAADILAARYRRR